MTEQERADMRTAYRPLVEGLAGKPGTVSFDEWAAAVDRVFQSDGKQEQARPSGSAPISTDTKGTTK